MLSKVIPVLAVVGLVLPAASLAHVSIKPKTGEAGTRVNLRLDVENESSTASTVKFDLQLPSGMQDVKPRPPSGWRARVVKDGGADSRVVVTATGDEVKIGPGEVIETFPMSARLPERAGRVTFKVVQTYDNGDVARWIGPRGSEQPSAFMRVTAAAEPAEPTATSESDSVTDSPGDEDDGGDNGWILPVALAGAAAIVIVGLILWRRRRAPAG